MAHGARSPAVLWPSKIECTLDCCWLGAAPADRKTFTEVELPLIVDTMLIEQQAMLDKADGLTLNFDP